MPPHHLVLPCPVQQLRDVWSLLRSVTNYPGLLGTEGFPGTQGHPHYNWASSGQTRMTCSPTVEAAGRVLWLAVSKAPKFKCQSTEGQGPYHTHTRLVNGSEF